MAASRSQLHNLITHTTNLVESPLDLYRQVFPSAANPLPVILRKVKELKDVLVQLESEVEHQNLDMLDHDTNSRQQKLMKDCQYAADHIKQLLKAGQIANDSALLGEIDLLIDRVIGARKWFKALFAALENTNAQISRLSDEQQLLREEIHNLRMQKQRLDIKVRDLDNASIGKQKATLQADHDKLLKEISNLSRDNTWLEDQINMVKTEDELKLRQLNQLASAIMNLGERYPISRPQMTAEEIDVNMSGLLQLVENCRVKLRSSNETRPMAIRISTHSPPSSRPATPLNHGKHPLPSPSLSSSPGGRSSDGEKSKRLSVDYKNRQWVRTKK